MPRVRPIGENQKDVEIRTLIAGYLEKRHVKRTKVGPAIGISASGFCAKMHEPWRFTVGELRKTYDYLKIPGEERIGL